MADANIEILRKETYLKAIENGVGNKLFNSLFIKLKDSSEIKDILGDGEFSCAFFVSSVLYLSGAVKKPHATVKSLKEFIENDNMWERIGFNELEKGDVVFWEKIKFEDGSENAHVGFIFNKSEAVSTDYKTKQVIKHLINLSDRKLEAVYRHKWDS